jgi:hypothetical protein
VVGIFFKMVRMVRRSDTPATPAASKDIPKGTA